MIFQGDLIIIYPDSTLPTWTEVLPFISWMLSTFVASKCYPSWPYSTSREKNSFVVLFSLGTICKTHVSFTVTFLIKKKGWKISLRGSWSNTRTKTTYNTTVKLTALTFFKWRCRFFLVKKKTLNISVNICQVFSFILLLDQY